MKAYQKPHINKKKRKQTFAKAIRDKQWHWLVTLFKEKFLIQVFSHYEIYAGNVKKEDALKQLGEWEATGEIPEAFPEEIFTDIYKYLDSKKEDKVFPEFLIQVLSHYIPDAV